MSGPQHDLIIESICRTHGGIGKREAMETAEYGAYMRAYWLGAQA